MTIYNTKDNCEIFNKSFADDLLSYKLIDKNIQFSNGLSNPISDKKSILKSLMLPANPMPPNIWYPIFIDNDNNIINKVLSNDGGISGQTGKTTSGRLGIEDFIEFKPEFNNWNAGESKMSIDWILNRSSNPYVLTYGIMCWVRALQSDNSQLIKGAPDSIYNFPIGSRISRVGSPTDVYIKLSDDLLYATKIKETTFSTSSDATQKIKFSEENPFIKISSFGGAATNIKFILSPIVTTENRTDNSSVEEDRLKEVIPGIDRCELWIANGDCFSYYKTLSELNIGSSSDKPSSSYISASLHNIYTQIYHILTLDEKKTFGIRDIKRSRLFKKLSHYLSTSPWISEFAINSLDSVEIKELIKDYLKSQSNSVATELVNLTDILIKISSLLQNKIENIQQAPITSFDLDTRLSTTTLNNNLITTSSSLFKKLIEKYGAKLVIKDNLSYKNTLIHGDSIVIGQIGSTLCNKTLKNTTVFNNQEITIGQLAVKTVLNDQSSEIKLVVAGETENTVYLRDLVKTKIKDNLELNIVMEEVTNVKKENMLEEKDDFTPEKLKNSPLTHIFRWDGTGGIKFKVLLNIDDSLDSRIDSPYAPSLNEAKSQISCFWEQVSGPRGFFSDQNKQTKDLSRFDTSTSQNVTFIIGETGRHMIQCTVLTPFGTFIKQKTFYVVDGREVPYSNTPPINNIYFGRYRDDPNSSLLQHSLAFNGHEDINLWKFPDPVDINNLTTNESPSILPNKDNLRVLTCNMNKIAINRNGMFWPIKTDFNVERDAIIDSLESHNYKFNFFPSSLNVGFVPNEKDSNLQIKYTLNNTVVKLERVSLENLRNNSGDCSQCLSMCEPKFEGRPSTTYDSSNIGSTVIRYSRAQKSPDFFNLQKYSYSNEKKKFVDDYVQGYNYPLISTDLSPKIASYGGYSSKIIKEDIGIDIPDHKIPEPNNPFNLPQGIPSGVSVSPIYLPSITGFPLNDKSDAPDMLESERDLKLCYQKSLPPSSAHIEFSKGVFHPGSGWLPYDGTGYTAVGVAGGTKNSSSVLKFNPGARETFSFTGPGLFGLKNGYNNGIEPNIYRSAIKIDIAPHVRWAPLCKCPPNRDRQPTYNTNKEQTDEEFQAEFGAMDQKNQIHKEYSDQLNNRYSHGYRILGGGYPRSSELNASGKDPVNDEFIFSSALGELVPMNGIKYSKLLRVNKNNNQFSYSFAVSGPSRRIPHNGKAPPALGLRNPRVNGLAIEDIEVKLNFLNYVNTKNLVIWLEVQPSFSEMTRQLPLPPPPCGRGGGGAWDPPNPDVVSGNVEFIDQSFPPQVHATGHKWPTETGSNLIPEGIKNKFVGSYLKSLTDMNSSDGPSSNFKIYLLNQEQIQNKEYNFSIKFSDHASNHNCLYDQSTANPIGANSEQNIIKNNGEVSPTTATFGYSTRDHSLINRIINTNRFNITNNKFSKLKNKQLFTSATRSIGCGQEGCSSKQQQGTFDSPTVFILNIAVIDEPDDMIAHDTVVTNAAYTNFDDIEKKPKSSDIYGSLCSWEIILHTGKTRKPAPSMGGGLSTYGNADALSLIEYGKDPQYPGYNFIANMSDKKHLLPLVNLNAPNIFMHDAGLCESANPSLVGKGSFSGPVRFPAEAVLQIMVGILGGAMTGTLVGAMMGPTAGYYAGYQALFGMFQDMAYGRALDATVRNIYSPDYSSYPFGSPEKILINASKDGCFWYKLEASIFKYANTPILENNRYKFIRLKKGILPSLGEFSYSVVESMEDLIDPIFIKKLSITDCKSFSPRSGSFSTISDVSYEEGDIVDVSFVEPCDPDADDSPSPGLYVIKDGSLVNLSDDPSALLSANKFLQYNHISNYKKSIFDSSFLTKLRNKQIVLLETNIPYNIFDVSADEATASSDSMYGSVTYGSVTPTEISMVGTPLTPTFGDTTPTADGFTVQISNYDSGYTWAGAATALDSGRIGRVTRSDNGLSVVVTGLGSTGLATIRGVAPGTSSTATITTTHDASGTTYSEAVTETSLAKDTQVVVASNFGIRVYSNGETDDSKTIDTKILNKASIMKDGKYYTLLEIPIDMSKNDTLCGLGETLLVFKNQKTSTTNSPISLWGLDKNQSRPLTPESSFSLSGLGSYGNGSPLVNKNILTCQLQHNNLKNIYQIFNNIENDKIKYNQVTLFYSTDGKKKTIKVVKNEKIAGYAYSSEEYKRLLLRDNFQIVSGYGWPTAPKKTKNSDIESPNTKTPLVDELQATLEEISRAILNSPSHKYDIMYLKSSSFKNISQDFGELIIEDDYIEKFPIQRLTPEQISGLSARLQKMESVEDVETLDKRVGKIDTASTTLIVDSSNIRYLQEHYTSLPDDAGSCYGKGSDIKQCNKKRTYRSLQDRYLERNDILKVLEDQAIPFAKVFYTESPPPDSEKAAASISSPDSKFGKILAETDEHIIIGDESTTKKEADQLLPLKYGTKILKDSNNKDLGIIRSFIQDKESAFIKNTKLLQHINIDLKTDSAGAYQITYKDVSNDYYWINIDPKQSCSIAEEMRPKVLIKTEYICSLANPLRGVGQFLGNSNICPSRIRDLATEPDEEQADISNRPDTPGTPTTPLYSKKMITSGIEGFESYGNRFIYTVRAAKIKQDKEKIIDLYKLPGTPNWERRTIERWFSYNSDTDTNLGGSEMMVLAKETYDFLIAPHEGINDEKDLAKKLKEGIIKNDFSADVNKVEGIPLTNYDQCITSPSDAGIGLQESDGSRGIIYTAATRVYNIFNLDDTANLRVQFRKIPRQVRGIDLLTSVFRYGKHNLYQQINSGNPPSPEELSSGYLLINNFYAWQCLQKNAAKALEQAPITDFLQLQNEMMFRAFYGSVDGIENKSENMRSLYPWELIPYEYFTK